jgi:mono/diheme cytochrome c family protein
MAKTIGVWTVLGSLVALALLPGCGGRPDFTTVDDGGITSPPATGPGGTPSSGFPTLFSGKVARTSAKAAVIAGGTLLVTKDGHAIAADPDRDSVHIVDLTQQSVVSVALQEGDEPGRVVEGDAGTVYVAARRGGVVAVVDVAKGTARRIPVCSAPRGLAYDAALSKLYVACRSGVLAVVNGKTHAIEQRSQLDPDLRDVVVSGEHLVVTRFKSAEVMVVSREGSVLRRAQPLGRTTRNGVPAVAYRTMALPSGGVLVGHVEATETQLPSGVGAYYGASCGGSVADLTLSAVQTALPVTGPGVPPTTSTSQPNTQLPTLASHTLGGVAGPLDFGFSPDGARAAVLGVGNSWSPTGVKPANLFVMAASQVSVANGLMLPCASGGGFNGSGAAPVASTVPGEPVAVAFDLNNAWVVQSRQPAQLQLENGTTISLAADDRFDTGLAMFHMNTGGGVSCTSCHPEAGEDGHTWSFQVGLRRSQALEGKASARAPFHWEGDLVSFEKLFDEVMMKRMSLAVNVTGKQRDALQGWIDSVPYTKSADDLDAAQVERGKVLFENRDLACSTCHGGKDYTDNQAHDVGTGRAFITPSLVGVGARAPLFHDGCATTLEDRFGPCGGGDAHGLTSKLTQAEEADLVAFMRSL